MLYRLSVVKKRDISTLQHNVHKVNSRHINRKTSARLCMCVCVSVCHSMKLTLFHMHLRRQIT